MLGGLQKVTKIGMGRRCPAGARHALTLLSCAHPKLPGITGPQRHPEVGGGLLCPCRSAANPPLTMRKHSLQTPETAGGAGPGLWVEGSDGSMKIWEPSPAQLAAEAEAAPLSFF